MTTDTHYFLITDIGSTTTKAILIDNGTATPEILGISHAETTVEAPRNDVRYGVYSSIMTLSGKTGITLLEPSSTETELHFSQGVRYLTTSSAGGGLQILVIGLTLFDSASSARRAAYGAGGILLDVFAIDDHRSAADQMMAMRNLRPDMILLCGGTDGGAISGVLRLAEILRIAKPLPKYSTSEKIPTIFAGNKETREMIKSMISEDFNLTILPNLRPRITEENLQPTREMIQKLFMENVMERAPGYAELKKQVSSEILPTPMGVLNSLVSATEKENRNFFAFDVGGATTDVFSYIKGHYLRTVSANLGMSYSALNVLSETGIDRFIACLPNGFNKDEVRNYIGNKTLYPTYNPQNQREAVIEHSLAQHAIRMATDKHQELHYNSQKIGFLDKIKTGELDGYEMKFEYELLEASYHFYPSEIDVLIGAGGIFSHAANDLQNAFLLINGFNAHGITELWQDTDFITPHLGLLSATEPKLAKTLLESKCLKKLAIHIRPHFHSKGNKPILDISYTENGSRKILELLPEKVVLLSGNISRELTIKPMGKCVLGLDDKPKTLITDLPVIIDTRSDCNKWPDTLEHSLFNTMLKNELSYEAFTNDSTPQPGKYDKVITLPYKGEILFNPGDRVQPDSVVAVNKYNPPRLFIVNAFQGVEPITEELVRQSLLIGVNDRVDFNTRLRHLEHKSDKKWVTADFISPVRGKVEYIDYKSGILVLSEIQDYTDKPVTVNLAEKLGLKPRQALAYFKRDVGNFVYLGDTLVQMLDTNQNKQPVFVHAPTTGVITKIDRATAEVTIHYNLKPTTYPAHINGIVTESVENQKIVISYEGTRLEARLGLGKRCHGKFLYVQTPEQLAMGNIRDAVLGLGFAPELSILEKLANEGIAGLICPGLQQGDLVQFMGSELGVINSGNESLPYCILIADGFGRDKLGAVYREVFALGEGKLVHLEPHTRIRAGVARPFMCFFA